ncbi:MAG: hypothetical protein K2P79_05000 [Sphingomonas sp.]|nr:hypothetical protein [Sphingomonas sp.]
MFGWLNKRKAGLQPEAKWVVQIDPAHIRVADPEGRATTLAKAELSGVAIETNDSGPWGADLWWLLFGAGDQLTCTFPGGATGEAALLDYLTGLPEFDHAQMALAMCSTANAVFPLWRKTG